LTAYPFLLSYQVNRFAARSARLEQNRNKLDIHRFGEMVAHVPGLVVGPSPPPAAVLS
jgi:hypothetical protein